MVTRPEERVRSTQQIYDYFYDLRLMRGDYNHFCFDLPIPFGEQDVAESGKRLVIERKKDALVLPLKTMIDIDYVPQNELLSIRLHNFRKTVDGKIVPAGSLRVPVLPTLVGVVPPNNLRSFSVEASKQYETLLFSGIDEQSGNEVIIFSGSASEQSFGNEQPGLADLTFRVAEAALVYPIFFTPIETSLSSVA